MTPNRQLPATWTYHNGTKHSRESIRSDPHSLDWENYPLAFKIYATLDPFGPNDFALRSLRPGDYRQVLIEASGQEPVVARAPVLLVCTSAYWRNAWKYQARTYRHCFWDAGTLLANTFGVGTGVAG